MIDIRNKEQGSEIILRPNCSADWSENRRIIQTIMLFNAVLGMCFAANGAWLVLPFIGLEMLLLWLVLAAVFRKLQAQEVVSLDPQNLSIDVGHHCCEHHWQWPRQSSFVLVTVLPHPWDPLQISISHCGECVSIGDFLNKDDSRELLSALRNNGLPVRHYCGLSTIEA
ncbi:MULTISPECIES: DUF2244 domain-containing protein [Zhongshania]|jgi:uncharacterized membrane protein|uniref:Putative membrane protein n=1 Tax=Zhongshania antarctica TaxID=641702 RepID=A0A840R0C3_9GAMM|nr:MULTISPECIES: DUF2244 domain-containing protein [Zhongshania]MBB5186024.1 putative membrane protein [Zhongshania antarctica]